MKLTVCQFIGSTGSGGAETLTKDYALLLDKRKFNVIVVVRRRYSESPNDIILSEKGVKVYSIYKHNGIIHKMFQKLFDFWYVPYKLRKIIKKENVRVLHIHLELLKYVKRIQKYLNNISLFFTCHTKPELVFRGKEREAASFLIKNNDLQIIALHDQMKREIDTILGISSTIVIRNGIDFNRFYNCKKSKGEMRDKLGIAREAFVIGNVGRFSIPKNHEFLIDIFAELKKRNPESFLLLIGDGPLKKGVISKLSAFDLKDYLILSNRTDIPELLKAMDVFVFPSLYEGLGIALIEAQVSGLRCVVSNKIPKEAIRNENVVVSSLSASVSSWCDAIMDSTIIGKAYGDLSDYDMNKEIHKLEECYLKDK